MSARASQGPAADADAWHRWLLHERHGGDARRAQSVAGELQAIRDRVLDGARLAAGATLLDIGTGDGLIACGALEREPTLRLICADPSAALLSHVGARLAGTPAAGNARLVCTGLPALDGIADGEADRVTMRAVLPYVADKRAAFGALRRVLAPGGRLSLAEPVFADRAYAAAALLQTAASDAGDPSVRYIALLARITAAAFPSTLETIARDPLTNFDERTIVSALEAAGFDEIAVSLEIAVTRIAPMSWQTYLDSSPYAGAPTVGAVVERQCTADDKRMFTTYHRPRVEGGMLRERRVYAYASAIAPRDERCRPADRSVPTRVPSTHDGVRMAR